MTTVNTVSERPTEKAQYLQRLRRELSVLPRHHRESTLRDVSDHLDDAAADLRPLASEVGTQADIAHAGLEGLDAAAGRSVRPSLGMLSKRLQVVASMIYAVPLLAGFIGPGGPSQLALLQLAPLLLIALPPLLSTWRLWWRISLTCTTLFGLLLVASVIVSVNPSGVPFLGTIFLVSWASVAIRGVALLLMVIALVRAPAVLRRRRLNP
ncbi:HAAS signaling domain-containing protein [Herbiconiux liukaitaii]|uniref:HAAS signaling domain-containing protein n=1 Tax=Herbiconiux liukaitaii TaxID=3342799 RepID=UPI0035B7B4AA